MNNLYAQSSDWSCKCACPCSTPGALSNSQICPQVSSMPPPAYVPPPPPSSQPPIYRPTITNRATEFGVSDTRNQPVDMSKSPGTAFGAPAGEAAFMSPPPAYTSPPPTENMLPPPAPAYTSPPSGMGVSGTEYTPPTSDLPKGWEEPIILPPGAVRLEDLQSPYGASPPVSGSSVKSASPPLAPSAQVPPSSSYQPIQQQPIQEFSSETEPMETAPPPSRWGN